MVHLLLHHDRWGFHRAGGLDGDLLGRDWSQVPRRKPQDVGQERRPHEGGTEQPRDLDLRLVPDGICRDRGGAGRMGRDLYDSRQAGGSVRLRDERNGLLDGNYRRTGAFGVRDA